MNPVSLKYFHDHVVTSSFTNQSTLAQSLDILGKRCIVESSEISPLTVRLFGVKNGIEKVSRIVDKLRLPAFPAVFQQQNLYSGSMAIGQLQANSASSGSVGYVQFFSTTKADWSSDYKVKIAGMADYNVIEINNEVVHLVLCNSNVHTFELHCGLYEFFANLDSVFDRLRLEINSIYFDGDKVIDSSTTNGCKYWNCYVKPNSRNIQLLINNGYTDLANILTGSRSRILDDSTGKYRNRLIHDGTLDFHIDPASGVVYISHDPVGHPLQFDIEMIPLLDSTFRDTQMLLYEVYDQIVKDLAGRRALPLI